MKETRRFDGRSWSECQLTYSYREKVAIIIASKIMPFFSYFLLSDRFNTFVWKVLGVGVGYKSRIRIGTRINVPSKVSIGDYCLIHGVIKSRGGVSIGNRVEFVEDVFVSSQSHNVSSKWFESVYRPVVISDCCWIGPRAAILQGVCIGEGSVVGANAVVTSDVDVWGVYAGVPAKLIKSRIRLAIQDDVNEVSV